MSAVEFPGFINTEESFEPQEDQRIHNLQTVAIKVEGAVREDEWSPIAPLSFLLQANDSNADIAFTKRVYHYIQATTFRMDYRIIHWAAIASLCQSTIQKCRGVYREVNMAIERRIDDNKSFADKTAAKRYYHLIMNGHNIQEISAIIDRSLAWCEIMDKILFMSDTKDVLSYLHKID